ncbi:MAG: 2-amino-4-hydroxy-6-hydroxymethyldihydropteridine diphosphokinase [Kineosporiaceae bacterium]
MSRELDTVTVRGIEAVGRHGVLAPERRDGQPFSCDVTLHVDTRRAGTRDDLAETVDYSVVAQAAHAVLAGPPRDLVETVAAEIADVVLADPRVAAVDVTVHKPRAPIPVPFADVSVTVHRTRADVRLGQEPLDPVPAVVALGSNLGDRADMLLGGAHALARTRGVEIAAVSPVVESEPLGGPGGQSAYLNAVLLLRTRLSPLALLHACQDAEAAQERRRDVRWGPRTLDVDLLTWGDVVASAATLELPHPRAGERGFVLVPWHLMDAEAVLPSLDGPRRVADLVAGMAGAQGRVAGVRVRQDVRLDRGEATAVLSSPVAASTIASDLRTGAATDGVVP